ncbi:hypothetical protein MNBD_GAMMA26-1796 [hydrothermal vent metagenome]|uniref:Uncharacterized protein n=1 Tax=hydrothermal vent metagenome TaxID=652676 RepID=A0A3B1BFU4_9ZZZZ
MRPERKPGLFALAFLFLVSAGMVAPALAALQDYGIWMSAISGSSYLRLEERLSDKKDGKKTKRTILESRTRLRTNGIVWDYRFMTFAVQLSYTSTRRTADIGKMDSTLTEFAFTTELFPVWYFPYRPISLYANKNRNTIDGYSDGTREVDITNFGAQWGLWHKILGRTRMSYSGTLRELTDDEQVDDDGASQNHELNVEATKVFRKGQWGESDVNYGYEFDFWNADAENSTYIQNYLFATSRSKLGEKALLSTGTSFFRRSSETTADDLTSSFFSADSSLSVRQTENFSHSYSLRMSRLDSSSSTGYTNYTGNAGFRYRYRHEFNNRWSGNSGAGLTTSFSKRSETGMETRGSGSANGSLAYRRRLANLAISGGYNLSISQPLWATLDGGVGNNMQGAINQTVQVGYTRLDSPLYTDTASASASYGLGYNTSQNYSALYKVESRFSIKSELRTNAKYKLKIPDLGDKSSRISLDSRYIYRFGRNENLDINGQHTLHMRETSDSTWTSFSAKYRSQFLRRANLYFTGRLAWSRVAGDDMDDLDTITGSAALSYTIGKFFTSLSYSFSTLDDGDEPTTDQVIGLLFKRNFSFRL